MHQSNADPVASVDEQVILSQTQELCRLLNVSPFKFNPYRIDWQDHVNHGKVVVPVIMADECCIDPSLVTLQKDLKDVLSPSDWKPLIASSLFYAFRNKAKLRRKLLVKVVVPAATITIVVGIVLGILAFYFLTPFFPLWLGSLPLLPLGLFLAAYLASFPRAATMIRRAKLESDLDAARSFGREDLLESLKKVERLHLDSIERYENRSPSKFLTRPTPRQRIDNLRSASLLPSY